MDDDTKSRVERLVAWVKTTRRDLLDEKERPSPSHLAKLLGGNPSYWSDVLRIAEGKGKKSFAAKKAREIEPKLDMPHLHLDGAGWPFLDVPAERFFRLSAHRRGRVEQLFLQALEKIEAEPGVKPATAQTPPPIPNHDAERVEASLPGFKPKKAVPGRKQSGADLPES